MPTNVSLLQMRFAEVTATAAATAILRQIDHASNAEVPTKAYSRSRLTRRELWAQLAETAQRQVQVLGTDPTVRRRPATPTKPKVVAPAPEPVVVAPPANT